MLREVTVCAETSVFLGIVPFKRPNRVPVWVTRYIIALRPAS
jgi:hypothetical protein